MKKKIIIITTSLLPLASVNADYSGYGYANHSRFYIKAGGSGSFLNKITADDGVKQKAKVIPGVAIGVGYYVLENLRTDLTLEYYINPTFKGSITNHKDYGNQQMKNKLELGTLMINSYVDLFDIGISKFFIGGGVGIAKHKTKYHITGTSPDNENIDFRISTKKSNNFAYALSAGMAFRVFEFMNIDLTYSWKDFGKTNPKKNMAGENMTKKVGYKGHNIALGLRIDL